MINLDQLKQKTREGKGFNAPGAAEGEKDAGAQNDRLGQESAGRKESLGGRKEPGEARRKEGKTAPKQIKKTKWTRRITSPRSENSEATAMELKLVRPSGEYAGQVMRYREEMLENNDSLDGCAGLEDVESFSEWIDFDNRLRRQHRLQHPPLRAKERLRGRNAGTDAGRLPGIRGNEGAADLR